MHKTANAYRCAVRCITYRYSKHTGAYLCIGTNNIQVIQVLSVNMPSGCIMASSVMPLTNVKESLEFLSLGYC